MRSDLIDLELELHYETPKAYLVSTDGDRDTAVWVPKYVVERDGDTNVFTMPERYALQISVFNGKTHDNCQITRLLTRI